MTPDRQGGVTLTIFFAIAFFFFPRCLWMWPAFLSFGLGAVNFSTTGKVF